MTTIREADPKLDIVKGLGCLLVVLVHVGSSHFSRFNDDWWVSNVYGALGRPGVPLFFMVTGALLIPRMESLRTVLLRRVPRVFWPLLFWSAVYAAWKVWMLNQSVDLVGALFGRPTMYHLWYLYAVLGLALAMPILSAVWASGQRMAIYVVVIWFLTVGILVPVSDAIGQSGTATRYGLQTFVGNAGYMLLGALIYHHRDLLRERVPAPAIIAAALLGIALTAGLTAMASVARGEPTQIYYRYTTGQVILMSAAIFAVIVLGYWRIAGVDRFLEMAGRASLGVYGVHLLVVYFLSRVGISASSQPVWFGVPLATVLVLIISWVIASLARRVAPLKAVA